jgi:thymidylate synthase ThyX
MTDPTVSVCYHNGVFTMPVGYDPPADRFTSTSGDNLCELAGRVCYDSINKDRPGRSSAEYFAHILSTSHYSVIAHVVETFELRYVDSAPDSLGRMFWDLTDLLHCRPGVWVTRIGKRRFRFALSLRAVVEWFQHGPEYDTDTDAACDSCDAIRLYMAVLEQLKPRYPLALSTAPRVTNPPDAFRPEIITVTRVPAELPKEQWCSLYIAGVSRDLLQELVRHHWQTNPSVRSTRYVDESACQFIRHPAITDELFPIAAYVQEESHRTYRNMYRMLVANKVDKKTARGAARSCLLGATETKMIFSLSKFQARHLLALRSNESTGAVDPEIKNLSRVMRERLIEIWSDL